MINLDKLLEIGIELTREKDVERLLEKILNVAMEITNCDGGTLYTLSENYLNFKIMITKSKNVLKGCSHGEITLPPVPMKKNNVCSCSAIEKKLINIADVYSSSEYDFSGPKKYDSMTGYKTKSMLVVPMEDDQGDIIGVLQLINSMTKAGEIVPFNKEYNKVISSLASQVAISLSNMNRSKEISVLLDSFVRVMSTAIDERTPYNARHTRNMVKYGTDFVNWLEGNSARYAFSDSRKKEFIMSIWLHDVGKLLIPLEIMDKQSRLGDKISDLRRKFEIAHLKNKIEYLETNNKEVYDKFKSKLDDALELIEQVNVLGYLNDEILDKVSSLTKLTISPNENERLLNDYEITALSIRKGTLTSDERKIMESHVVMTEKILSQIQFSKNYKNVTYIASSHHEFLDGNGYPKGMLAEDIPDEVRILTILDIYEALTAVDRPYKKSIEPEKAFKILYEMAEDGKLDKNILDLFKKSCVWKR